VFPISNNGNLFRKSVKNIWFLWYGYWTTHTYANSRTVNSQPTQLADWTARGLVKSRTTQFTDWSTHKWRR